MLDAALVLQVPTGLQVVNVPLAVVSVRVTWLIGTHRRRRRFGSRD